MDAEEPFGDGLLETARYPGDDPGALSRRTILRGIGALGAGAALAACAPGGPKAASRAFIAPGNHRAELTSTTPHTAVRKPGSRPNPKLPIGTDTIPQIEHIVVLMLENHSYDDHFGMLRRGDGFKLGSDGLPLDANPYTTGNLLKAFHMPSSCQLDSSPGQNWDASHTAWDNGRNDGFVTGSGPVAMGYWDGSDIPFYYGLGKTFPVADRWFCSVLAQTYPNRRFLMAGTAAGIVSTTTAALFAPTPPNGTIFDRLDAHKISWTNYYTNLPSGAIIPSVLKKDPKHFAKMSQFLLDAKAGKLPSFSIVDPDYSHQSEEDPQDIRQGERFAAAVINAVMHGKSWAKTLLIWTYDEHGGYYDHVPPPAAIKPDNIPPEIHVPPDIPGGYGRYGFRVPAVIVSPYARKNYVSHVVHDHTSILKLIETKWNLPALTYRDANADNLLDSLDLKAKPAFLTPPKLPAPALPASIAIDKSSAGTDHCTEGNPGGTIPPPGAIVPLSEGAGLRIGAT
jgi:phospholipase C